MRRSASWILSIAVGTAVPAAAADMYRWVDEQGRTTISDVVPERYRARATRIDPQQFEPTERQRAEALALSAGIRARAASAAARAASSAAPSRITVSRSSASAAAPAGSDCQTRLLQYAQAQSCFAPCQQANGTVKAECFSRCQTVQDPSRECGLPKLQ